MYLSYSAYKIYLQCPLEFWHRHISRTPLAVPDNRVNSLYGSAIGEVFERFYNDRLWLKGSGTRDALLDLVEPTVDRIMANEIKRGGIYDWNDQKANYSCRASVVQDVKDSIGNGVEIIKYYKLLGPIADAEVVLDTRVRGHLIRGRADFVIRRIAPYSDLVIVDGKGSKHRGRYVDGMQLRWYAMLYKLRYQQVPDTLAFLFWRFPPAKAIDWVPFDHHGLDTLLTQVLDACDSIEANVLRLRGAAPVYGQGPFQPIPEEGHCQFCSYQDKCPDPALPRSKIRSPKSPFGVSNGEDDISLFDV